MPRSPSARCLANVVDLYRFAPVYDVDGGLLAGANHYPTVLASAVACSVQPREGGQEEYGDRVTDVSQYVVYFGSDPGLRLKDKIVWQDGAVTRSLYVDSQNNAAGMASNWAVDCTERL